MLPHRSHSISLYEWHKTVLSYGQGSLLFCGVLQGKIFKCNIYTQYMYLCSCGFVNIARRCITFYYCICYNNVCVYVCVCVCVCVDVCVCFCACVCLCLLVLIIQWLSALSYLPCHSSTYTYPCCITLGHMCLGLQKLTMWVQKIVSLSIITIT